jgi:hypothetical protein
MVCHNQELVFDQISCTVLAAVSAREPGLAPKRLMNDPGLAPKRLVLDLDPIQPLRWSHRLPRRIECQKKIG